MPIVGSRKLSIGGGYSRHLPFSPNPYFSYNDTGIDTDEALDNVETGIDCDADATTAIPAGSIIKIDTEFMFVTATGTTLTVVRPSPVAHNTNADIYKKVNNCVLWLPGQDDPQSATIRDRSGLNNHGTITGATWAKIGAGLWALNLDGIDDGVEIVDAASLDIVDAITIGGWAKPGLANTEQYWIAKGDRGVAMNYVVSITATNYFAFEFYTTPTWYTDADDTTPLSVGTWYNLMATYDKVNVKLYINGELKKTIPRITVLTANALSLFIGREGSAAGTFFKGIQVLNIITNQAISGAVIANKFNQERHLFGI